MFAYTIPRGWNINLANYPPAFAPATYGGVPLPTTPRIVSPSPGIEPQAVILPASPANGGAPRFVPAILPPVPPPP